MNTDSITGYYPYVEFCQRAAENDEIFKNFKRDEAYIDVVQTVSYEIGNEYLSYIIKNYPQLESCLTSFLDNDQIGNPELYSYSPYGFFSPTTIRYIKVAGDLIFKFGDLSQMHILEIGGGYGGQCFILKKCTNFASYTLIDIPQANALTKKYLKELKVQNINIFDYKSQLPTNRFDLVISNFAFTECDRNLQLKYINELFKSSSRGYITGTITEENRIQNEIKFLSFNEFVQTMNKHNINLHVSSEMSFHPTVKIITWNIGNH